VDWSAAPLALTWGEVVTVFFPPLRVKRRVCRGFDFCTFSRYLQLITVSTGIADESNRDCAETVVGRRVHY
jgi:hypothetical protein